MPGVSHSDRKPEPGNHSSRSNALTLLVACSNFGCFLMLRKTYSKVLAGHYIIIINPYLDKPSLVYTLIPYSLPSPHFCSSCPPTPPHRYRRWDLSCFKAFPCYFLIDRMHILLAGTAIFILLML